MSPESPPPPHPQYILYPMSGFIFRDINNHKVSSTASLFPFNQRAAPVQQLVFSALGNETTILNLKGDLHSVPPSFASCFGGFKTSKPAVNMSN